MQILAKFSRQIVPKIAKIANRQLVLPFRYISSPNFSVRSFTTVNLADAKEYEFKTETKKILDIVTNSIYTDKEVFLRELISNASDACEQLRHVQLTDDKLIKTPLQIEITTDEKNKTLTIHDTGVGMNKEQLVSNLGTLARSGTRAFLEKSKDSNADLKNTLIGQFGVGFYSSFMVADNVDVYSCPVTSDEAHLWTSDGSGKYKVVEAKDVQKGTTIVLHIKQEQIQFCTAATIERIIKKYSNFINFPILLNGKKMNTIEAIWMKSKSEIKPDQYTEFYRYIGQAWDEPMMHLHYTTDAPLSLHALFYVPSVNNEKHGYGRTDPKMSLYSRKVLIEGKTKRILPDWLRFITGLVDSDDLPLSISRENPQDSALIERIKNILTKRILNFFGETLRKDRVKYEKFFKEFNSFLVEGAFASESLRNEILNLLLFETAETPKGKLVTIHEYIETLPKDQQSIYFLSGPSRDDALNSPYYESFKAKNINVIFVYAATHDFLLSQAKVFENKKLISCETSAVENTPTPAQNSDIGDTKKSFDSKTNTMTHDPDTASLIDWFKMALNAKAANVKLTDRLVSSPAMITSKYSSTMHRFMVYMDNQDAPGQTSQAPIRETLEINIKHPFIQGVNSIRHSNPEAAKLLAEQLYDNCAISAGLLSDPRQMVSRLSSIMDLLLDATKSGAVKPEVQKPQEKPQPPVIPSDSNTGPIPAPSTTKHTNPNKKLDDDPFNMNNIVPPIKATEEVEEKIKLVPDVIFTDSGTRVVTEPTKQQ